jgi:predicted ArsR family transcriptional regulator
MASVLVRDTELLWVVEWLEPTRTRNIAPKLPIDQNSVYVRLRSLRRQGYVGGELLENEKTKPFRWELTDLGRTRVAEADLPPAAETDFEEYFSGRTNQIDPTMLLEELAVHGEDEPDGWVPTSVLYPALPFSKVGIRNKLHLLQDDGLVDLDSGAPGKPHRWRVTSQGYERLEAATDDDTAMPIWVDDENALS